MNPNATHRMVDHEFGVGWTSRTLERAYHTGDAIVRVRILCSRNEFESFALAEVLDRSNGGYTWTRLCSSSPWTWHGENVGEGEMTALADSLAHRARLILGFLGV